MPILIYTPLLKPLALLAYTHIHRSPYFSYNVWPTVTIIHYSTHPGYLQVGKKNQEMR